MLSADVRYIEICCLEYMDLQGLLRFGKTAPRRGGKRKVSAAQFRNFARQHNAGQGKS